MITLNIPKTLQVGGHTYSIALKDGLADDNERGLVNHRLQRIEINPQRPDSQKSEALIHETLHIINLVYANGHLGEDGLSALSEGLFQLLQQLGIVFDWGSIPNEV